MFDLFGLFLLFSADDPVRDIACVGLDSWNVVTLVGQTAGLAVSKKVGMKRGDEVT